MCDYCANDDFGPLVCDTCVGGSNSEADSGNDDANDGGACIKQCHSQCRQGRYDKAGVTIDTRDDDVIRHQLKSVRIAGLLRTLRCDANPVRAASRALSVALTSQIHDGTLSQNTVSLAAKIAAGGLEDAPICPSSILFRPLYHVVGNRDLFSSQYRPIGP